MYSIRRLGRHWQWAIFENGHILKFGYPTYDHAVDDLIALVPGIKSWST